MSIATTFYNWMSPPFSSLLARPVAHIFLLFVSIAYDWRLVFGENTLFKGTQKTAPYLHYTRCALEHWILFGLLEDITFALAHREGLRYDRGYGPPFVIGAPAAR